MAFARGKFGIEYNTRPPDDDSSGLGWVFALAAVVALVSFAWTLVGRFRAGEAQPPPRPSPPVRTMPAPAAPVPAPKTPRPPSTPPESLAGRPVKLQHLFLRLEEAERQNAVEMAVSTIEEIRRWPGSLAADRDDALARRLGELNVKRLFELRNAQWVKTVTVKRGDSASRIAAENGSTLASLVRLNVDSVDKLVIGRKLFVMDHPRFSLVVHRRTRTADLSLNGKFFRRYDVVGEVGGAVGTYEMSSKPRALWRTLGVAFSSEDRAELEMLLPVGAPVLVSEM